MIELLFQPVLDFGEPIAMGIFPVLGIAIAALATGTQVATSIIAQREARDAERTRRGAEELRAQRERLQTVREARIRRAEVAAAAEAQGATGASAVQGAQASIGTQLASNLGFIEAQNRAAADISQNQLTINTAQAIGEGVTGFAQGFENFRQRQQQANAIRQRNAAVRVN